MRRLPLFIALAFAVGLAAQQAALAGSNTWFSGATSGSWQTTSHWGIGLGNTIVPGAISGTTNTDTATFDSGSTTTSIIPDASRNLKFLTFDTSAAAYTIGTTGGNALLMTSGGTIELASTFSATNRTETIDAPFVLEGNYTFADNSANAGVLLDFGGAITSGAAGGIALTVSGAGDTTISGAISNGSRTTALVKSGAGTLALSGNNTFTGGVTIDAGILEIANAGALNSALPDAVAFGPGSTGSLILKVSAITLGGLSTNATVGTPVVQTFNGVQTSLTINNASDNTFGGVLKDGTGATTALSLIKSGAGTLTLSGSNTFTGGVTINAGNLQLGSAGALNAVVANTVVFGSGSTGSLSLAGNGVTISGLNTNVNVGSPAVQNASATPAALTINNAVSNTYAGVLQDGPGGGALALVKSGSGTFTLGGNNTFTGGLTINAGNLVIGSPGALNTSGVNGVTFPTGSTGVFSLEGNSVTINGLSSIGSSPVVQNAGPTAATLTINTNTVQQKTFSGVLQDGVGGSPLSLTKNGHDELKLDGNNTFTGAVTVNAGKLTIGKRGALNYATPNAVAFGAGSTGVLKLDADFQIGFTDLTVGGLTTDPNVGTPAIVVYFRSVSNTNKFNLTVNNSTNNTFNGMLAESLNLGTLTLIKTGAGTLTLGGNNSINLQVDADVYSGFTGGVRIDAGTLQLGNAAALNANAVSFASQSTGTLALNGISVAVGGLNSDTINVGNPIVQNASSTPAALTVNGGSAYSGTLQDGGTGALSLTKAGSGTLALSGTDSYTGNTTVTGGTLQTTGTGTLGNGASTLTISAANGVTSAVSLGNSQSVSSISGTLGFSAVVTLSIGPGVTLTDNQSSGNTNFQGALINSGTFAKSGTSSLEMNGAPTLNANSVLQVNGGTLRFNFVTGTAAIGSGVTATVASGATLQLAGPISALSSGANRVNISNNSNSTGLIVSGTNQQVGNIDGAGTTQVNAGSDLTANHIIQGALVIGGTAGSPALVAIASSDTNGNSLDSALDGPLASPNSDSGGVEISASLVPESAFADSSLPSAGLNVRGGSSFGDPASANSAFASAAPASSAAVPEPSTLVLGILALCGLAGTVRRT